MPRPNKHLPHELDLPCIALAADLRALRERCSLTLARLSALSGLSTGTLSSAQSGTAVPTEKTVIAFVEACGERDTAVWLARREAALRGPLPARPAPGSPAWDGEDAGNRLVWRSTWARWDKTRKITPPSKASSARALSFWLEGLRAYRSVSFRALARETGYSHTTLSAMAAGVRPVTVPGLLAFLAGCKVTTFAERIEWLDLLERTASSPRRRLDAARERARLADLSARGGPRKPGESALQQPTRPAWPRRSAVHVDLPLLHTDLRTLRRHYGPRFLTVLAQHTGIPSKTLTGYIDGELLLHTGRTNLLAAAVLRIGDAPPPLERLPHVLPRMADWHLPAPSASLTPQAARKE